MTITAKPGPGSDVLAWAQELDQGDLDAFLAELTDAAMAADGLATLAVVEETVAAWHAAVTEDPIPYVLTDLGHTVVRSGPGEICPACQRPVFSGRCSQCTQGVSTQ